MRRKTLRPKAQAPRSNANALPADLFFDAEPCEFLAAAGDAENGGGRPTFAGTAYSGGIMYPCSCYGMPVVVELASMTVAPGPRPMLYQHNTHDPVGHTTEIAADGKITVAGVLSCESESSNSIATSARNKFPWRLSVGGRVRAPYVRVDEDQTITVNGRSFRGPLLVAKKFELREISFVTDPGDDRTSVRIAAGRTTAAQRGPTIGVLAMRFDEWLRAKGFDPATITEAQRATLQAAFDAEQRLNAGAGSTTPPAAPSNTPASLPAESLQGSRSVQTPTDPLAAANASLADFRAQQAAEIRRVGAIAAACGHDFTEIQARAVAEGWDEARTRGEVTRERELRTLRAGRPTGPSGHGMQLPDGVRAQDVIVASMCLSMGTMGEQFLARSFSENTLHAAMERQNRGMTIHQITDMAIRASGGYFGGSRKSEDFIRAGLDAERSLRAAGGSGFSTISLSGILSAIANKTLEASYLAVAPVHPLITAPRNHGDFKVHTRYMLTADGGFKKVGPTGELKHMGLQESQHTNRLDTYGALIVLNRHMWINDDLGAFLQIPQILGRAAAVKREELVFALMLTGIGGFFSADNSNYIEGAPTALSITGLTLAETAFVNRVDANKQPVLLRPALLLVGAPLGPTARNLYVETAINETTSTDAPKPAKNPHAGKFTPVVSPYLNNKAIRDSDGKELTNQSDTQWGLFANPADRAAIGLATLNGKNVPTIESADTEFTTLGMQWRAFDDVGAGWEDPAAALWSKGKA